MTLQNIDTVSAFMGDRVDILVRLDPVADVAVTQAVHWPRCVHMTDTAQHLILVAGVIEALGIAQVILKPGLQRIADNEDSPLIGLRNVCGQGDQTLNHVNVLGVKAFDLGAAHPGKAAQGEGHDDLGVDTLSSPQHSGHVAWGDDLRLLPLLFGDVGHLDHMVNASGEDVIVPAPSEKAAKHHSFVGPGSEIFDAVEVFVGLLDRDVREVRGHGSLKLGEARPHRGYVGLAESPGYHGRHVFRHALLQRGRGNNAFALLEILSDGLHEGYFAPQHLLTGYVIGHLVLVRPGQNLFSVRYLAEDLLRTKLSFDRVVVPFLEGLLTHAPDDLV